MPARAAAAASVVYLITLSAAEEATKQFSRLMKTLSNARCLV